MEGPSQGMAGFAFDVFDRYGYLKADFKNHCIQKGTGVWGEELDHVPLLLIEHTVIKKKEWRRSWLGKALINLLINKGEEKSKPEPYDTQSDQVSRGILQIPIHEQTFAISHYGDAWLA